MADDKEVMRFTLLSTATGANLGEFSAEGLLSEAKTDDADRGAVKCRGTRFAELAGKFGADAKAEFGTMPVSFKPDGANASTVNVEELVGRLEGDSPELGAVIVPLRPFVAMLVAAGELAVPEDEDPAPAGAAAG